MHPVDLREVSTCLTAKTELHMFKDSLKHKGQVRRPLTLYVGEEDGCCASKNMGGGCSECCIVALLRLAQQAGMTFQPSTIPNRERGKKKKKRCRRQKRRGRRGGASGFHHAVPSASIHLAFLLLNQTAWLVLVL